MLVVDAGAEAEAVSQARYTKKAEPCWHCSNQLQRTRRGYSYRLVTGHDGHPHKVHAECELAATGRGSVQKLCIDDPGGGELKEIKRQMRELSKAPRPKERHD